MDNEMVYENANATDDVVENLETLDSSIQLGIFEKILIVGGVIATGVTIGFVYKNRQRISDTINGFKVKKLDREIEKTRSKLVKLESKKIAVTAEEE